MQLASSRRAEFHSSFHIAPVDFPIARKTRPRPGGESQTSLFTTCLGDRHRTPGPWYSQPEKDARADSPHFPAEHAEAELGSGTAPRNGIGRHARSHGQGSPPTHLQ